MIGGSREITPEFSRNNKKGTRFQLTGILRPGLRGLRVIVGKVDTNNRIDRGSHDRFEEVDNTGISARVELCRR
jgi:hypothetical protein